MSQIWVILHKARHFYIIIISLLRFSEGGVLVQRLEKVSLRSVGCTFKNWLVKVKLPHLPPSSFGIWFMDGCGCGQWLCQEGHPAK